MPATHLLRVLRAHGIEATDDAAWTAAYSSDASLYRVPPRAVAFPRDHDQVVAAVAACNETAMPITARGAGTSVAGNAIGPGLVLDFSRHLNRVLHVDASSRTARVEAGVVHAALQRQVDSLRLRFGPDPSTHTRCTIGGMIGNNACGARSLAYGRTVDNVVGLRLVGADGRSFTTGYDANGRPVAEGVDDLASQLRGVVGRSLAVVRTEFGGFGRQVSGYGLEHLAPERGLDLTKALVGSEATLALTTEATVRLVCEPSHRRLVVLAFESLATAGDATPSVLEMEPSACEGLDARIVDVVRRRKGSTPVPALPDGNAWLLVELSGDDLSDVLGRAKALEESGVGASARLIEDPAEAAALWRVREDGAGLAGRAPSGKPAHAGWEDAAVPPERLGEYLRGFELLLREHGLTAMPYGHFGEGCIHVRLDFDLERHDGGSRFRRFVEAASDLVVEFGGSNSGEHGDGRARSELLPKMYSPAAVKLMAAVKGVFDPGNLLNPGLVVGPASLDDDLRASSMSAATPRLALTYVADDGDFAQAVHRCTGVGKCRADSRTTGGVMCPSFAATKDEVHSTRGRARILQEVVNGSSELTWDSPRSTKPWTSASPARDACPTARPASTWRPTSPKCCSRHTGDDFAQSATTAWAGSRCGQGWRPWHRPLPTRPWQHPWYASLRCAPPGSTPGGRCHSSPTKPSGTPTSSRLSRDGPSSCSLTRSPTASGRKPPTLPFASCEAPATPRRWLHGRAAADSPGSRPASCRQRDDGSREPLRTCCPSQTKECRSSGWNPPAPRCCATTPWSW